MKYNDKRMSVFMILQIIFIGLKIANLSTLTWFQTFIPLYMDLTKYIIMYTVAFIQIKRENEQKKKSERKEEIDKAFK